MTVFQPRAESIEPIFKPYTVGKLQIEPGLVLSPMSGVTTSAFRRLIKELNPGCVGLLVSEFISVEGMTRQARRSIEMMRFHPSERPYAIQIFGYDPQRMRDAAVMCEQAGVDLVDVNCGCPAPKVVRRGGGCELMRQPSHLAKVFREVRAAISVPLTMKMRSGWDENSKNCVEIARVAESEGIEAIAVHGRTRAQLYRGLADWDFVAQVAQTVRVPVLGSGDVVDRASASERLRHGVAGLMVGRGAISNPLIFRELVAGQGLNLASEPQRLLEILERYVELLREEFPPKACIGKLKQLVSQCARGNAWRKPLCLALTFDEQIEILRRARGELGDAPGGAALPVGGALQDTLTL